MAPRITAKEWTERAVADLQKRAQDIGLLGADEYLLYTPYDKKEGTHAAIGAWNQYGPRPKYHWMPVIQPNDSHRTVERLADAQAKVLYALDLQQRFVKAVDALPDNGYHADNRAPWEDSYQAYGHQ